MRVELYTRPGCHLCDDAHAVIESVRVGIPLELVIFDVTRDPVLEARYGHDVPVVLVGGRAAFRHRLDAAELRSALEGR